MTKYLVTGAAGLFGINFCLNTFRKHQVVGSLRQHIKGLPFETTHLDLLERGAIEKTIEKFKPDVIVHAAADADVDHCERHPDQAYRLNAQLPGQIAEISAQRGIQLIHISTDAVFYDSTEKFFSEFDLPNPINAYGKSKYEGEQNVLSTDPNAIIARVNFFGWSLTGKKSLAEFFYNHLSANKACYGFPDVYFCPLYVEDLSELFHSMVDRQLKGLYHVIGSDCLSKYEFGREIAKSFGFDIHLISPKNVELSTLYSPRSHNLRLSNTKLSTALGTSIPGIEQGLERFYTQHQQSYPQKLRSFQHH